MTTTTTEAPQLTLEEARQLTARIRDAVVHADGLLLQGWRGKVWRALGHRTFEAWVQAEVPELQTMTLRGPALETRVRQFREAGASFRAAGAAAGTGPNTAREVLRRTGGDPLAGGTVTSLDGRTRPATRTPEPAAVAETTPATPAPFTDQLVALVARLQPVTAAKVEDETGRRHGAVSAALHRLSVPGGRLTYTRPAKRGQVGTYSIRAA